MNIDRLTGEELTYELAVFGLKGQNVEEMRKLLRSALKRNTSFSLPEYPFTFQEDKAAVEGKLVEIIKLIETLDGGENSSEYKKIEAKGNWVLRRLSRIVVEQETESEYVTNTRQKMAELFNKLDIKLSRVPPADEELEVGPPRGTSSPLTSSREGRNTSSPLLGNTAGGNIVPVYKWGVKFSGVSGESINGFLERVEELREARGCPVTTLYSSAVDLFEGKALIWLRANKPTISNWNELVSRLKEEFLPPGYQDRLMEEIRHRTQGSNESIGMFVSVMLGLFRRLSEPVSAEQQLATIQKNLAPFYSTQLALVEITSITHLVSVGRKLEATRFNVENYMPPPSRRQLSLLEPDLSYIAAAEGFRLPQLDTEVSEVQCFRCRNPGHVARHCPQPIRCYGCNSEGVIRRNCTRCSSAGNRRGTQ